MSDAAHCAANSVHLYQAIFRAHGLASAVADGVWTSRAVAPPYYSNAVTLTDDPRAEETMRALAGEIDRPFSVKDAFSVLDLTPHGYRVFFDAVWLRLDPVGDGRGDVWRPVGDPAELADWEAAWAANGSPTAVRVFPPELLRDASVGVLARYDGDSIVAGCIANRSPTVVGFSNFFTTDEPDAHLSGAVDAARSFAPGLPVVGYDRNAALERMLRLGFQRVGPLRVWKHPGP